MILVSIEPFVVTFWFVFELIVESFVDSVTIGSARATPLILVQIQTKSSAVAIVAKIETRIRTFDTC